MPRFVLLYHDCPPGYDRPSHWDLMCEQGEVLRTWALSELPRNWQSAQSRTAARYPGCAATAAASVVDAEPLGDHRRDYLEYEGLISGERGCVIRIDAGTIKTITETAQIWRLELAGVCVQGEITLAQTASDRRDWILSCHGAG
jgi:hypothetical protein